jgi:hypothetical protein
MTSTPFLLEEEIPSEVELLLSHRVSGSGAGLSFIQRTNDTIPQDFPLRGHLDIVYLPK